MARKGIYISLFVLFGMHPGIGVAFVPAEQIEVDENLLKAYHEEGSRYFQQGQHEKTIEVLKKAILLDPSRVESYYRLVRVYSQLKRWPDVVPLLNRIIEIDSSEVSVYLLLGNAYLEQHRYLEGSQALEEALKYYPNSYSIHYNLGLLYFKMTRYKEATREYTKALVNDSLNAEAHYNLGLAYMKQSELSDAITEFKRSTEIKASSSSLGSLALIYLGQGRSDEAKRNFEKALLLEPHDPIAHYNLGLIFLRSGDYNQAIRKFEKALEFDPAHIELHYNLGLTSFKKGQLGEAIEWFQKTLELDPGHVGGHYNLAKAYLRIGESEKGAKEFETFEVLSGYQDEIEAFLSGVVESYPPSKEIQIRLGKLYLKALKYPKVIEALQLAITLGSAENDTLFYTLAQSYYQLGKNELAIQALQKTLEINPSHLEARFNLVLVYRLQGKGKEAAEEEGIYNRLKKKKSK